MNPASSSLQGALFLARRFIAGRGLRGGTSQDPERLGRALPDPWSVAPSDAADVDAVLLAVVRMGRIDRSEAALRRREVAFRQLTHGLLREQELLGVLLLHGDSFP